MAYDFNADEIFEMAEQIERNGVKFYKNAADKVDDPAHKDLLIRLSQMEVHHEKIFAQMRAELSDMEKESSTFDPGDETRQYLRALADTRVFFNKKMDLGSMKEILKSAVAAEKESIVFYLGMKKMVPPQFGANRLDDIIQEEMDHIVLLSKELKALKG